MNYFSITNKRSKYFKYFACLFSLLIVYYLVFIYSDIRITHHVSFTFLDLLFDGKLSDFYDVCISDSFTRGYGASYYISLYIIFAIWELPAWLLFKFGLIAEQSTVALLWIKSLVVLFVLLTLYYFEKVIKYLEPKDKEFFIFIFSSSLFLVIPSFAVAQYDSISLSITLLGLLQCLKDEKVSIKTIAWFSVAISLKLFALIPFIILILLKEKRISIIILDLIGGLTVPLCCILPFLHSAGFQQAVFSFGGGMIDRLGRIGLSFGTYSISFFFLCFFCVCILAYYWNCESNVDFLRRFTWLITIVYFAIFTFMVNAHPFWIVLISPFLVLLIATDDYNLKINLILETFIELTLTLIQAIAFYWVMLTRDSFDYLVLKKIPVFSDVLQINNFSQLISKLGFQKYIPILNTLFFVLCVFLLGINAPWLNKDVLEKEDSHNITLKNGACFFRIFIIFSYLIMSILITFFI